MNPAVGGFGDFLTVGDENDGGFFPAGEGGKEVDHSGARGGVEIPRGFIGKEDGGAVHEGAGEGGALELAAGELVGAVMGTVGQTHGIEEVAGPGFTQRVRSAGEKKR